MERQATDWEKTFANHEGLVSGIHMWDSPPRVSVNLVLPLSLLVSQECLWAVLEMQYPETDVLENVCSGESNI